MEHYFSTTNQVKLKMETSLEPLW